MARTRISATVDTEILQRCRDALDVSDDTLVDRALRELARGFVDLDLPYDGEIPEDVRRLAAERCSAGDCA